MKDAAESISCLECTFHVLKKILNRGELEILNDNKNKLRFKHDETIIRQGSFVSQILFLRKGIVKNVLENNNDRNTIIKIVEEDSFVALPVLSGYDKYPFSVIAMTDCEVCVINIRSLHEIMHRNPAIYEFLLKWYSNDYSYMYEKLGTISSRNRHGKVASALLYLTNGTFKANMLEIISRKDLAELSSTSVESANKILQELNRDGIINISRNKISIKRRDLILKLSTVG
jgi:CRP/FNR family transcriptional regulator